MNGGEHGEGYVLLVKEAINHTRDETQGGNAALFLLACKWNIQYIQLYY